MTEKYSLNDKILVCVLFLHPDYEQLSDDERKKAHADTIDQIIELGIEEMGARISFMIDHDKAILDRGGKDD